jgi:type VI secretion system protein ImpA
MSEDVMHRPGAQFGVEYTDEFQLIDQLVNDHDADADAPQRQGVAPFQWSTVADLGKKIVTQCADLRVGIWMLRAAMATESVSGVRVAMLRLADWCELPAEQLFPLAEAGEDARELHVLTLSWLTSPSAIYALGNTVLHKHWPLTLEALANHQEPLAVDELIKAEVLTDISATIAAAEAIEGLLSHGSFAQTLSLARVLTLLNKAKKRLAPPVGGGHAVVEEEVVNQPNQQVPVPLTRRDEVQRTLGELIDYFKTHEPGHPAPLFLTRVQRMMGASFEDLMRELYQDAPQLVAKLDKPAGN